MDKNSKEKKKKKKKKKRLCVVVFDLRYLSGGLSFCAHLYFSGTAFVQRFLVKKWRALCETTLSYSEKLACPRLNWGIARIFALEICRKVSPRAVCCRLNPGSGWIGDSRFINSGLNTHSTKATPHKGLETPKPSLKLCLTHLNTSS